MNKNAELSDCYKFNDYLLSPTLSPVSGDLSESEWNSATIIPLLRICKLNLRLGIKISWRIEGAFNSVVKNAKTENWIMTYKRALRETLEENEFLRKTIKDLEKQILTLKQSEQEKIDAIRELSSHLLEYEDIYSIWGDSESHYEEDSSSS